MKNRRRAKGRKPPRNRYVVPALILVLVAVLFVVCVWIFLAPEVDDQRLLARGNEMFHESLYLDAASLYDEEGVSTDLPTRRYNAGVAYRRGGNTEEAITRFEKSSTDESDDLRARSFFNLGNSHYDQGHASYLRAFDPTEEDSDAADGPPKTPEEIADETREERLEALREAAGSFVTAIGFYRRIDPPDDNTRRNIEVAKTAQRQSLDEIARIEEEKQREKDEEALKDPSKLLPTLIAAERLHRIMGRGAAKQGGRGQRLASRRLRKAEAKNRGLTERLVNYLEQNPNAGQAPGGPPGQPPSEDDKKRTEQAIATIARAVDAQKKAEVAFTNIDPASAAPHLSTAILELRNARIFFKLDPKQLADEALANQTGLLGATRVLDDRSAGGPGNVFGGLRGEIQGSGFGKRIVQALKDKVLQPIARLMTPSQKDELELLSGDEDDVIWTGNVLEQVTLDAKHFAPAEGATAPAEGPSPEEQAETTSAALRQEAKIVHDEALVAKTALEAEKLPDSIAAQEKVIAALEAFLELLPKQPEPEKDVVQQLRELIERQKLAEQTTEAASSLEADARMQALAELGRSQQADGTVAEEIAEKLAANEQEPAHQEAAGDVEVGRDHIEASALGFVKASAEGSSADNPKASITNAVAALEKALEKLDQKNEGEDQQQDQNQGQDQQQLADQHQGGYSLTPRQARALKDEMDEKRREKMEGVYTGPRAFTVEKDW